MTTHSQWYATETTLPIENRKIEFKGYSSKEKNIGYYSNGYFCYENVKVSHAFIQKWRYVL